MSMLRLENVYKVYPGQGRKNPDVLAVSDFSIDVKEKEFIVFIGPSGCGKSTTLRMIAGLEENTKGNIYIDDQLMNDVEPKYRNIAMVFQNYALYPHMTARENMSFGLKNMKVPTPILDKEGNQVYGIDKGLVSSIEADIKICNRKIAALRKLEEKIQITQEKIKQEQDEKKLESLKIVLDKLVNKYDTRTLEVLEEKLKNAHKDLEYFSNNKVPLYKDKHLPNEEIVSRVNEAAKILDIEELLDRRPKAMSGGQRQRVALGRAIVRTPKIFLLDEPLSNLDAKLRQQMRVEIINLYNKLDIPFIYVTHDQVEAMSMGTRIVIMRNGVIQQVDSPTNLYDFPVNRFVAGFLGTPQMNFVEVIIKKTNDTTLNIKFNEEYNLDVDLKQLRPIQEQYLDGEEHQVIFGIRSEDVSIVKEGGFAMKIILTEVLGSETLAHTESLNKVPFKLVIKSADRLLNNMGEVIYAEINKSKIHLFTSDEKETSIFKKEE